jgi:hypothetical protein
MKGDCLISVTERANIRGRKQEAPPGMKRQINLFPYIAAIYTYLEHINVSPLWLETLLAWNQASNLQVPASFLVQKNVKLI